MARLDPRSVGGQALLEGVMMRSPRWWAVAVRRPDGELHTESHPIHGMLARHPRLARTPLRGALGLADAVAVGLRALAVASQRSQDGDEEAASGGVASAALFVLAFFIVLFLLLPVLLVGGRGLWGLNLLEGVLRIGILCAYVLVISRLGGVARLFGYHGAEHKVIAAYEAGGRPDAAEAWAHRTQHVRCGTNFLALAMLIALVVYLPLPRDPWWERLVLQLLLLPVVAALAYELLRLGGRFPRNPLVRAVSGLGLLLQRITTREPCEDQLEVALASFTELRRREEDPPPSPPEGDGREAA